MKRAPDVVSHLVHELSPPSHEHSESLPEGQALLQAPDGKERRALLVDRDGFFEIGHVIYLYLHC